MSNFISIPVTASDDYLINSNTIVTAVRVSSTRTIIVVEGGASSTQVTDQIRLTHSADTALDSVAKAVMDAVVTSFSYRPQTGVVRAVVSPQPISEITFESSSSIVDDNNSVQNLALGAGITWSGDWSEIIPFQSISVLIDGTAATTAPGTLKLQFSQDAGVTISRDIVISEDDITSIAPRTLGVIASHFRVQYINGVEPLTDFDVQTMYHSSQVELVSRLNQSLDGDEDVKNVRSVITGQDPDGIFRNVVTTRAGNLDVTIADANDGFNARVTPGASLKVADQTHLVGEAYGDAALLTSKYIITLANGGTQDASVPGQLEMKTNTAANGSVKIQTKDVARFIPANYNTTHHAVTIPEFPRAINNIRRWGAFNEADGNPINGSFFQIRDGVWQVGYAINGVITTISQVNWNGNGADTFNTDSQNAQVYEIEYNAGSIRYTVNGRTVHRVGLLATPYAADIHFPSSMVNENTGGSTTNVDLFLRAGAIYTLGKGEGVARPIFISGTTAGQVIKTSPGKFERLVFSRDGTAGGTSTVEVYDDNVTPPAAANQIGRVDLTGDGTNEIEYDLNFNNGLVVIITTSGGAATLGTTITFD
jgi:hypothetical protein